MAWAGSGTFPGLITFPGFDALSADGSATMKIEIAFVPGVWTDVTIDVDLSAALTITHPRFAMGEVAQSMTLDMTLKNIPTASGVMPYTPDNPMSPLYPNVSRDRIIRVTATKGASSWVRFLGFIDRWQPDGSSGEPTESRTQVSASGIIARYARRTLLAQYQEAVLWYAGNNSRAIDLWPLDDGDSPTTLRNVGFDGTKSTAHVVPGKLVPANGDTTGQASFGSPDGGLLLNSTVGLSRSEIGNASSPVMKLQLQNGGGVSRVSLWAQLAQAPVNYDDLVCGYDRTGKCLWRFGPVETLLTDGVTKRVDLAFCGPTGIPLLTINVGDANDGAWRWYSLLFRDASSGGGGVCDVAVRTKTVPDAIIDNTFLANDSDGDRMNGRDTRFLVVGGYMQPRSEGTQVNSFMGSVAGVYAMHGAWGDTSYSDRASPDTITTGDLLVRDLSRFGNTLDSLVGSGSAPTGDSTPVCFTNPGGRTLAEMWSEMATTSGGLITENPDGTRAYRNGASCRPTTVGVIVNAETDCDGGSTWEQVERPTRVTASSPIGSVTIIDAATEAATSLQSDGSIETNSGTVDYTGQVAGFVLRQGDGLRLAGFSVDLTTSEDDLWADFMAMKAGDRGRLTGLPVGYYGATQVDYYVDGWTETYTPDSVTFALDTLAADAPPKATTDSDEYGRVAVEDATITGGTCVGSTGTGTVVIASPTTPFSTAGGDYPLNLDWNGERITVAAPGGATSPQTFTCTARGITPTGARAHSSGEPVDIWHAATVAF